MATTQRRTRRPRCMAEVQRTHWGEARDSRRFQHPAKLHRLEYMTQLALSGFSGCECGRKWRIAGWSVKSGKTHCGRGGDAVDVSRLMLPPDAAGILGMLVPAEAPEAAGAALGAAALCCPACDSMAMACQRQVSAPTRGQG